jgi:transcriptional regulator with GAF, ATPase, and Fis domain
MPPDAGRSSVDTAQFEHLLTRRKVPMQDTIPMPQVESNETSPTPGALDEFFSAQCPDGVRLAGKSESVRRTLKTLRMVAESNCNPVLLLGETGTGKELAAQAVHVLRNGSPDGFVAVNCAALTANLLESELFGHKKGAFTGADREKTGLFEAAGEGTVFLDEISEMPMELQAKLLRVLQERTFRKVGGTETIECKATIIASSNLDLLEEIKEGRFRRDLYYRLAVFPITMPTLRSRSRRKDIPLLARYFVQTTHVTRGADEARLSEEALDCLMDHDWPGNVRELRNVIERAVILAGGEDISADHVIIERGASDDEDDDELQRDPSDFSLETAEREFILRALKETGWQRTRAAALLGITRATLHAKLKRYEIQPPDSQTSGRRERSRQACA